MANNRNNNRSIKGPPKVLDRTEDSTEHPAEPKQEQAQGSQAQNATSNVNGAPLGESGSKNSTPPKNNGGADFSNVENAVARLENSVIEMGKKLGDAAEKLDETVQKQDSYDQTLKKISEDNGILKNSIIHLKDAVGQIVDLIENSSLSGEIEESISGVLDEKLKGLAAASEVDDLWGDDGHGLNGILLKLNELSEAVENRENDIDYDQVAEGVGDALSDKLDGIGDELKGRIYYILTSKLAGFERELNHSVSSNVSSAINKGVSDCLKNMLDAKLKSFGEKQSELSAKTDSSVKAMEVKINDRLCSIDDEIGWLREKISAEDGNIFNKKYLVPVGFVFYAILSMLLITGIYFLRTDLGMSLGVVWAALIVNIVSIIAMFTDIILYKWITGRSSGTQATFVVVTILIAVAALILSLLSFVIV